jgi:hypothetical protein
MGPGSSPARGARRPQRRSCDAPEKPAVRPGQMWVPRIGICRWRQRQAGSPAARHAHEGDWSLRKPAFRVAPGDRGPGPERDRGESGRAGPHCRVRPGVSARTPSTTSSEIEVALRSSRTRTTVPSRIRRTIGSSASERLFQASQSLFTLRQVRLTVSLPTVPPNKAASVRSRSSAGNRNRSNEMQEKRGMAPRRITLANVKPPQLAASFVWSPSPQRGPLRETSHLLSRVMRSDRKRLFRAGRSFRRHRQQAEPRVAGRFWRRRSKRQAHLCSKRLCASRKRCSSLRL